MKANYNCIRKCKNESEKIIYKKINNKSFSVTSSRTYIEKDLTFAQNYKRLGRENILLEELYLVMILVTRQSKKLFKY